MATKPISLRVAEEVKVDLEQIARRFGTSPATLGADYVTQGVRTTKHPSIEFRQTPAGRMAYVRGVRLPVWLALQTVDDCGGDAEKAAKLLRLPQLLLEACWDDRRALVSKDRATLPGWISLRVADGKEHGGILFYDLERFKSHQIGALAKAIISALDQTEGNLANRWVTLH